MKGSTRLVSVLGELGVDGRELLLRVGNSLGLEPEEGKKGEEREKTNTRVRPAFDGGKDKGESYDLGSEKLSDNTDGMRMKQQ